MKGKCSRFASCAFVPASLLTFVCVRAAAVVEAYGLDVSAKQHGVSFNSPVFVMSHGFTNYRSNEYGVGTSAVTWNEECRL